MANLFFDLDGTLVDTLPGIARAINEALSFSGVPFSYGPKECERLIGRGTDVLIHRALQGYDQPSLFVELKAAYLPRYEKYQVAGSELYPGLKKALEKLKADGHRLFVYTNKPDKLAKELLTYHFGAGFFEEIQGQLETRGVKPNPEPIFAMMAERGLSREDSYYVGDSIVDYETSLAAGLPLILAAYGYGNYGEEWTENALFVLKEATDIAKIPL